MKIPSMTREYGLKFNLTPMIDIVFLLIIFFLIASHLSSSENHESVQLAEAVAAQHDQDQAARRIIVTVTVTGEIRIGNRSVTLTEFAAALQTEAGTRSGQEFEVRLRADQRVPYEKVEPLLIECARANVNKLKFNVVLPRDL